jgi:hypothetical protein
MWQTRFYVFTGIFTYFTWLISNGIYIGRFPDRSCTQAVAPVAVCNGVYNLTLNSGGIRNLNAPQLDDGSYDQNGNFLFFKIKRLQSGSCGSDDLFRSQLQFCCADAGDTIDVVLRVYNIGVDTGGINASFGVGNFDDCITKVIVGELVKPQISVLPNISLSCDDYTNPSFQVSYPNATDNCCLDTIFYLDQNITFDIACKRGNIRRRFTARDCAGNTATSTQMITVTNEQFYSVIFPADKLNYGCADLSPEKMGKPTILDGSCENMNITFVDTVTNNTMTNNAPCMTISRTWKLLNWCHYSSSLPFIFVPNPAPVAVSPIAPANLLAPTVGPMGTASSMLIRPSDTIATNFSIYWTPTVNGYIYQQKIFVYDTIPPNGRIVSSAAFCDKTPNDPNMWQGSNWYNPLTGSNDLFECPVEIALKLKDNCSGNDIGVQFVLYLDLNSDGVEESVVSTSNIPPAGSILYQNINGSGEQRVFDKRITGINNKFLFTLEKYFQNDSLRVRVAWNTMASPNIYTTPQLPYGYHRVVWTVADECGNQNVFEHHFTASDDCAPPVVTCVPDLTVSIPSTGSDTVTVSVNDLLFSVMDSITMPNQIQKAIERAPFGTRFPTIASGMPQSHVSFDCDDIGFRAVRIWAKDAFGNAAFCNSIVAINDPEDVCLEFHPAVSGTAQNMIGQTVVLNFDLFKMPDTILVGSSLNADPYNYYFFNDLTLFGNYFVKPRLDSADLTNGVNTYDLILISRHILNLEPLNIPFKLIAADVNRSGTVTTFDIVTLRKAILGTLNTFPNNASWRFVPRSFLFPAPENPFATQFPEQINLSSVYNLTENADFYAIKIGDVDYTATPNPITELGDRDKPIGMELFLADKEVKAGWTPLYLNVKEPLSGFQFALEVSESTLFRPVLVDEGHFSLEANVLSINCENQISNSAPQLLLGWLSETQERTKIIQTPTLKSEAYTINGEERSIVMRSSEQNTDTPQKLKIQPNPFTDLFRFDIVPDKEVHLIITNINGAPFYIQQFDAAMGSRSVTIDTQNWPSGIYFATYKDAQQAITLKMTKI